MCPHRRESRGSLRTLPRVHVLRRVAIKNKQEEVSGETGNTTCLDLWFPHVYVISFMCTQLFLEAINIGSGVHVLFIISCVRWTGEEL